MQAGVRTLHIMQILMILRVLRASRRLLLLTVHIMYFNTFCTTNATQNIGPSIMIADEASKAKGVLVASWSCISVHDCISNLQVG